MSLFNQSRTRQARKSALLSVSSPGFQTNAQDISVQRASTSRVEHSLSGLAITREETLPEQEREGRLRTDLQAAREGGHPLHEQTRVLLEPEADADISAVRIHTDALADRLASSFHARAFTAQNDIFFRSGAYQPTRSEGLHLLAHEVTHTVQQAEGPVAGWHSLGRIAISDPGDPFERAAQASADRMIAGSSDHNRAVHQVNRPTQAQHTSSRDTNHQIIQRAVDAKKSLTQASDPKNEVPGLPDSIVKDLANACQSTAKDAERKKVLDDIYQNLKGQAIIDNVDKLEYGGTNTSTYGLTTEIPNQQPNFDNKVKVEVFSAAFDSGAAVVYSTIRHELIHAEQYRQAPSAANPENDPFFYAQRGKTGDKNTLKGGTDTEQALKHALDEIETYSWEIIHASETGVQQAHKSGARLPYVQGSTFLEQRIKELGELYNSLIKFSEELTVKQQPKWKSLIAKGEQMVEDALKSQRMTLTKKPIKWRTDQPKQPKNPQLAQSMKQQSGGLASVNMKTTKQVNP